MIIVLRVQARHRVGMFHQGTCGRNIKRMLDPFIQLTRIEALKIGTLSAVDVDDLNIVTRFDEIAFCSLGMDADIINWISQWVGQFKFRDTLDRGPFHPKCERGGRVLCFEVHHTGWI